MRVQSLIDSLMTPQASHRKRVVEMNMVFTQKTRGRFASLGVLAPTVIRPFLHTTPTLNGVGEGPSGLLQPSAIAVYWSDQLVIARLRRF